MTSTGILRLQSATLPRLLETTAGRKAVMAVSGLVLWLFVWAHLLGNLQIFLGAEQFNGYAEALKKVPQLLWGARVVLLIAVGLHIRSAIQLSVVGSRARPAKYVKYKRVVSSYASRTMYMSGPILAAFICYHLLHFTFGHGGTAYNPADPYNNVVAGFRSLPVSGFYILSMGLLCLHVSHGAYSLFQTLGFHHAEYSARLKQATAGAAVVMFLGFASIPVAVLTGLIPGVR